MTTTKETNNVNLQSLADLAERVYYDEKKNNNKIKITPKTPYRQTDFNNDFDSGLKYATYQDSNNPKVIVLSFAGTDTEKTEGKKYKI